MFEQAVAVDIRAGCGWLSDGAQARLEGVGDEVYLEVGWGAHDDHHVILDRHGQAVVSDVAVGGIDKVIDFFLRDG